MIASLPKVILEEVEVIVAGGDNYNTKVCLLGTSVSKTATGFDVLKF